MTCCALVYACHARVRADPIKILKFSLISAAGTNLQTFGMINFLAGINLRTFGLGSKCCLPDKGFVWKLGGSLPTDAVAVYDVKRAFQVVYVV